MFLTREENSIRKTDACAVLLLAYMWNAELQTGIHLKKLACTRKLRYKSRGQSQLITTNQSTPYRSGTVNSKSFVLLQIKWKFELNYTL